MPLANLATVNVTASAAITLTSFGASYGGTQLSATAGQQNSYLGGMYLVYWQIDTVTPCTAASACPVFQWIDADLGAVSTITGASAVLTAIGSKATGFTVMRLPTGASASAFAWGVSAATIGSAITRFACNVTNTELWSA
jgi:hypothetical protein